MDHRASRRAEPRLKRDGDGRERCVACFLCQAVCPTGCLRIVAERSPWPDRELRPAVFEVDALRCIACGLCEEACPRDAIELRPGPGTAAASRPAFLRSKEALLSD